MAIDKLDKILDSATVGSNIYVLTQHGAYFCIYLNGSVDKTFSDYVQAQTYINKLK